MPTYEEIKQGLVEGENPEPVVSPVEIAVEQEEFITPEVPTKQPPNQNIRMLLNLVIAGCLAVAVCLGSLQFINSMDSDTSPTPAKKVGKNSNFFAKLLGLDKNSAGKKKRRNQYSRFGNQFDDPPKIPSFDPYDGFADF